MAYVLIIEDSIPDAELARAAILALEQPVEVSITTSPAEGLAELQNFEHRTSRNEPVLIWLDLNLPGLNGLELLKRLRAAPLTSVLPIAAFSGSDHPHMVKAALAAGANIYVHKPDDVDIYMERVGRVTEAFLLHSAYVPFGS